MKSRALSDQIISLVILEIYSNHVKDGSSISSEVDQMHNLQDSLRDVFLEIKSKLKKITPQNSVSREVSPMIVSSPFKLQFLSQYDMYVCNVCNECMYVMNVMNV